MKDVINATSKNEDRRQEGHSGAGIHNNKNKTLTSHYQGFVKDPERSCHLSTTHASRNVVPCPDLPIDNEHNALKSHPDPELEACGRL